MYIYLMRHGQTDWNISLRMQGRSDIALNETGLEQARRAAAGMQQLPLERIYSSPLQRARRTAQFVADAHDLPVLVEPLLTEMAFGELEGLTLHQSMDHPIFTDPEHYQPQPGGESYAQLDERCRQVLEELLAPLESTYQHVLLCSHGALIKGIVRRVLHRSLADFWCDRPQPNCSCTVLECQDGVFTLLEQGRRYDQ
jgi:probable phosphoglycerate mutase